MQSNSPAVNAGTAYFEWNSSILINLNPEDYNSTAPDLGAFESSFSGSENNLPPVAIATANPQNGDVPLTVQFSSDRSNDPDGTITTYAWDFGDGSSSSEANPSHSYSNAGTSRPSWSLPTMVVLPAAHRLLSMSRRSAKTNCTFKHKA